MPAPRTRSPARGLLLLATGLVAIGLVVGHALGWRQARADGDAVEPGGLAEVRIGYFANVTHAQAVLGVASGDFQRAVAPAKLTTHVFDAGPSLIEALFAGEIDIGYVGPSPALNAHLKSRGGALRVVAGAAANGVVIVARPGSGIARMEDLRGKRVATPQLGNTQDISARHYLVKVLGQSDAENVVPVPSSEQAAMMARGQIDAAWAVEPWGSRLIAEAGATVVGEEKDLWPQGEFSLTLVVASVDFLRAHPGVVAKFLGAHCDWTGRLEADRAAQAPALASELGRLTGRKLPEELVMAALGRVRFSGRPLGESLRAFARRPVELGLARAVPDVATLVDGTILDSLPGCAGAPTPARDAGR